MAAYSDQGRRQEIDRPGQLPTEPLLAKDSSPFANDVEEVRLDLGDDPGRVTNAQRIETQRQANEPIAVNFGMPGAGAPSVAVGASPPPCLEAARV